MKKEIKNLKDTYYEYKSFNEAFKAQKIMFQISVDLLKETLNIKEVINYEKEAYENAKLFAYFYPDIRRMDNQMKEKYPNDSLEERIEKIKEEFKEGLKGVTDLATTGINACSYFNICVDNYYIYESSNFTELKKEEEQLNLLKEQYDMIVKDSIKEVKNVPKKIINKGSKRLIKVLNKVEERTR